MFERTPKNYFWNQYYNHANEPVHHVPFLFNRLGAPELTQKWTQDICRNAYKNAVLGLVGNEDVGQMSAWYVLASSGIHPICPGNPCYEITSPVFEKVEFRLDLAYAKGKSFVIKTYNNSPENIYIQSAQLNGKPYDKSYLMHSDLIKGGNWCWKWETYLLIGVNRFISQQFGKQLFPFDKPVPFSIMLENGFITRWIPVEKEVYIVSLLSIAYWGKAQYI